MLPYRSGRGGSLNACVWGRMSEYQTRALIGQFVWCKSLNPGSSVVSGVSTLVPLVKACTACVHVCIGWV